MTPDRDELRRLCCVPVRPASDREFAEMQLAAAVPTLLDQLAAVEGERDQFIAAIRTHCLCRFTGGKLVAECHYHQCARCVRMENGDPSSVPWESRAAAAEARVARLREALQPFAEYVRLQDSIDCEDGLAGFRDDKTVDYHHRCCPTFGHCRAALRALEETAHP